MKKFILYFSFIFLVACKTGKDQYFQGKIHYSISYQSNMKTLPENELKKEYGSAAKYYFKKGNFKEVSNSYYMQKMVYHNKEGKLYYKHKNTSNWEFENVAKSAPPIDSFSIKENADSVLGISCNELYLKNDKGVKFYYYSDDLNIKPEWMKNFKKSNKNFIARKTGSIPLKAVMVYSPFTVILKAEKIERKKISDSLFTIDKSDKL